MAYSYSEVIKIASKRIILPFWKMETPCHYFLLIDSMLNSYGKIVIPV